MEGGGKAEATFAAPEAGGVEKSSKYVGVYKSVNGAVWRAQITHNNQKHDLGAWPTEEHAYQARVMAKTLYSSSAAGYDMVQKALRDLRKELTLRQQRLEGSSPRPAVVAAPAPSPAPPPKVIAVATQSVAKAAPTHVPVPAPVKLKPQNRRVRTTPLPVTEASQTQEAKTSDEIPWQTSGHDWIGQRVLRPFAGHDPAVGTVISWVPRDGDDDPLWHVLHDDGDEEDLEEFEMKEALELARLASGKHAGKLAKQKGTFDAAGQGWQTTGHTWLGCTVCRRFGLEGEGNITQAKVVGWMPRDGEDPPLWHVVHDDGDEEDLELFEMEMGLKLAGDQWNQGMQPMCQVCACARPYAKLSSCVLVAPYLSTVRLRPSSNIQFAPGVFHGRGGRSGSFRHVPRPGL
jgi:hypothetical protein